MNYNNNSVYLNVEVLDSIGQTIEEYTVHAILVHHDYSEDGYNHVHLIDAYRTTDYIVEDLIYNSFDDYYYNRSDVVTVYDLDDKEEDEYNVSND